MKIFNLTLILFITILVPSIKGFAHSDRGSLQFEEDHDIPIVHLNIISDVGIVNDPQNKLGLSNLAARMFLCGTQHKNKLRFLNAMEKIGASINVDTRSEGTVFRIDALSENLNQSLALVEEMFLEPSFSKEELKKLKHEIKGALLSEKNQDNRLIWRHYQQFLFGPHPYSYPFLGTEKGLSAISTDDLWKYYHSHYGSNTLIAFGSGDAKEDILLSWWKSFLKKLSQINSQAQATDNISEPIVPAGRRILIVNKPSATQSQVAIGHKGMHPKNLDFYAQYIGNFAFGGYNFQSTLMQELRVKRGWTYGASHNVRYGHQPKFWATYFFPKTSDTVPGIELTLKLLNDFQNNGITINEFNFAKRSVVNHAPFDYDTPQKRLENKTQEYLLGLPEKYYENFSKKISGISYDKVQSVLKNSYDLNNLSIVVLGNSPLLLPPLSKLNHFSKPEVVSYLKD